MNSLSICFGLKKTLYFNGYNHSFGKSVTVSITTWISLAHGAT